MPYISDNEIEAYKQARVLAVDIETYDPELLTKGPGTHRGKGYICGVGIGRETPGGDMAHYLSLTHPDSDEATKERSRNVLKTLLPTVGPKLGANFKYDKEWLEFEGYEVNGVSHDVQFAEPLLDEYARSYSLSSLAKKYSVNRKKTDVLEAYHKHMGWQGKAIANIWRMPFKVAEEYTLNDIILPLEIFSKQKRALERQNLWGIYELEIALIPLMLQMRRNGVRIDEKKLGQVSIQTANRHFEVKKKLVAWAGQDFNVGSSAQLAKLFDRKGIPYPRKPPTQNMILKGKTEGNPNLDKMALTKMAERDPICATILEYRHWDTMINMFLMPYSDMLVDGRLYASFNPLRSDKYGTVSGRYSCSQPNLQQVSAIKEEGEEDNELDLLKGKILRELFIPEEGHLWAKSDYSQIEYRIIAHYATGPGSIELREQYNHDPNTDFHKMIQDATGFDRRTAKRLNFGGAYGIGIPSASTLFGWSMSDSQLFMESYHKTAPYIKETRNAVSRVAKQRGYIFTILGRKARTHPSRKLHSMFNRLMQGSAADIFKQGMLNAYKAGLFETLVPHLFVHDEVDTSAPHTPEGMEALKELDYVMENAVKLDVPLKVDTHTGRNWAEAD
jgi:DNA polymerase I-like protein with 3'-5' exonuclease and polymerase domains